MATARTTTGPPIRKLSQKPKRIKMLVYAEPGGGKSVLAGSSSEVGNTLILNADDPDGPESMRAMGYDPDIWEIKNYKDLDDALAYLRGGDRGYDWVWLDSITMFQDKGLDDILTKVVAAKPHRSVYKPDKPEYGENQQHITRWIRHMKPLPFNFGVTAHVMMMGTDDDGEDTMYLPAIQGTRGQLSSKICGNFSIVGRLHVVRVKGADKKITKSRRLTTEFDGKYYAKDRFNATLPYLSQPTIAKLVAAVNSNSKKSTTTKKTTTRRKRNG